MDLQEIRLNSETTACVFGTHAYRITQGDQSVTVLTEDLLRLFLAGRDQDAPPPPKPELQYTEGQE